jgi:hypothetical protein
VGAYSFTAVRVRRMSSYAKRLLVRVATTSMTSTSYFLMYSRMSLVVFLTRVSSKAGESSRASAFEGITIWSELALAELIDGSVSHHIERIACAARWVERSIWPEGRGWVAPRRSTATAECLAEIQGHMW